MATLPAWNGGLGPPQNLAAYPFQGYSLIHSDMGTVSWIFGALVHEEVGFDYHLRKVPSQFGYSEFRAMSSKGRAALEQGDWQTAEKSFMCCKDMLMIGAGTIEHFGKKEKSYHSLMVWVNLFLAQSYQAMGKRVEVMELWRQIDSCVLPLAHTKDLRPQEAVVFFASAHKAEYELAEALGDSSKKKEAIQILSRMWSCSDDAAESRICFLLCCDYDRLGKSDDSLQWIRKANRVRMKDSAGWDSCKFYFLDYEARLLMRLQRFSEAAEALKDVCTFGRTRAVHELLHECYTEMSRRAADVQYAKPYEELAIEQLKLMQDLPPRSLHDLSNSEPLRVPMTFHLGSSGLGLARAPRWRGVDLHLSKLPEVYKVFLEDCFAKQRGALERCVWETATLWAEQMREILKMIRRLLPTESYDWLLSWVDLPLAGLYHHHARNYDEALRIWEEIQECEARSNSASPDKLELNTSKGYQIPFATLEYEMSISNSSVQGKIQIIQKWTRAYCTDEETAERELCFWLYFGYHRHGNYEHALKWLRMEKELRLLEELRNGLHSNGVCSRKRGRNIDYFCCDYDYYRCEIDLLTELGRHEEAVEALERLLNTKQCLQEDGFVDDIDKYQLADEGVQGQVPTAYPTATGCILLVHSAWDLSDGVQRLIQSPVGLEHHLLKLPYPVQLAFRKHGYLGRLYDLELVDWENATFQFEFCLEILETIPIERNVDFEKAHEWLMVWVMLPLADLYELLKKQYRMAFDLRFQMLTLVWRCVGYADRDLIRISWSTYLMHDAYSAMYMWAISDYSSDSDLKRKVIQIFGRILDLKDDWIVELDIVTTLRKKFMDVYENIEGALDLVRREKQLLDQRYQEPQQKLTVEYTDCVIAETRCLLCLQRPDESARVLNNYWKTTGMSKVDLPTKVRAMLELAELRTPMKHFFAVFLGWDKRSNSPELDKLRRRSCECEEKEEYAQAISYREDCVKLIRKNPNLEGLENPNDVRLGFKGNFKIAQLHLRLFFDAILSRKQQIKGFGGDEDFLLAEKYYKQCLRLVSEGLVFPTYRTNMVASIIMCLYRLYFVEWCKKHLYVNDCLSRVLPKTGPCDEDSFPFGQLAEDDLSEVKTFLEWSRKLPLQRIAERVISLYTRSLHTLERKQYTEGWIEWLEDHKLIYHGLQSYYVVRADLLTTYMGMKTPADVTSDPFYTQREIDASCWNAFLFAEGERTRVMLYQYEMHRRKSSKLHEVRNWGFDAHDRGVLRYIKESCRALLDKESTVFVQYSSTFIEYSIIYVIFIDQDGCKLFVENSKPLKDDEGIRMSTSSKRPTPQKRLEDFYSYLAYKQGHPDHIEICQDKAYRNLRRKSTITDDESMNKYLEFLYGALIEPIESLLDKVKPGGKLVLAPSELLTRVPFAALRKPGKDQKRLIERYAFTIVPSLRVLQMCSERLQELQNDSRPYTGRCGSIVALGNPTYDCKECEKNEREALPAAGKEVEKLVELFGNAAVMTLTERDATAKNLLDWAAKPSQESFRQAIVHIGAHGYIDKDDHRYNELQLACDPSVLMSYASASTSSGDQAKESDIPSARGKTDEHIEDDCSDGDESDSEVQDLVHDDGTLDIADLALRLHRLVTTRSRSELGFVHTDPMVIDEASSFASSSNSNATIRRSARVSSASFHDLTAEAINNLETRWSAELLVLSACQTSAGRMTAEGVLSLARAFMAAGVPCVVASLWKVDDDETLHLMADFYEELWKGNDVATALQSATLQCMARCGRDAVQYWAPFNVWGVPSLRIPKELQRKPEAPQPAGDDDSNDNREERVEACDGPNTEDDVL